MGYTTGHRWTKKEEKFLETNLNSKTNGELAKVLDLTPNQVKNKLITLKMKRTPEVLKTFFSKQGKINEKKYRSLRLEGVRKSAKHKENARRLGSNRSPEHEANRIKAVKNSTRIKEVQRKRITAWNKAHPLKREKNPNWRGGISAVSHIIRTSKEYDAWKNEVFKRDKYTCQMCKKRGGDLHAHHIKEFARYPDLRFEVSNGMTLHETCHRELHKVSK